MSFKEVNDERRQDWNQTSSGVGHQYRPSYYFPHSELKSQIRNPLPPELAKHDEITDDDFYTTTYGRLHDKKFHGGAFNNYPIHKKPPGHWNVNYVKDVAEKLGKGGWRRPLTMGNQMSEMKDMYSGAPSVRHEYHFGDIAGPQPFNLQDHHKQGPSKYGQGSSMNPKLQGKKFFVRDKGVLTLLDPYLSTTSKDHRSFKPEELRKYPRKDVPTYWQCEDYPKAWGHGLKHNPLPKDAVPREKLPMRDTTVFLPASKVRRMPKAMVPVPHTGLRSEYTSLYSNPTDIRMKENYNCPLDTPYTLPPAGSKSIMTVPKMYNTEYQHVGSGKPIAI